MIPSRDRAKGRAANVSPANETGIVATPKYVRDWINEERPPVLQIRGGNHRNHAKRQLHPAVIHHRASVPTYKLAGGHFRLSKAVLQMASSAVLGPK